MLIFLQNDPEITARWSLPRCPGEPALEYEEDEKENGQVGEPDVRGDDDVEGASPRKRRRNTLLCGRKWEGTPIEDALHDIAAFNLHVNEKKILGLRSDEVSPLRPLLLAQTLFTRSAVGK